MLPTLASVECCSGCGACKAVCTMNAIVMVADEDGFLYPHIDDVKCIGCHLCEKICPVLHPRVPNGNPTSYAAYTKNLNLRLASSSGGIFTELARLVLENGGVVFGCVWERPKLVAIHVKVETVEDLAEMRGSKYVQSDLRNTFREAKKALLEGRQVLYSGTPCQIAGLNAFLGKKYDKLLAVELICHGVPAPAVFEKYKDGLTREVGSPPVSIAFRNKHYSWRRCSLVSTFADTSEHREDFYTNRYMRAFLNNLCLRPSCYMCASKGGRSCADLTIADFWGIENVCPEYDDNLGTSLVLVHSEQGKRTWSMLSEQRICSKEVLFEDAILGNPSYLLSVRKPEGRIYFMQNYKQVQNFETILSRSMNGPWIVYFMRRVCRKIRRVLGIIKKELGKR